jgi:cytoskeletal protein CcmA (bactofilin family)
MAMRKLRGRLQLGLVAFAGALLLVGLLPATVLAADTRQGQSVTVGPNEVVNDDLYVMAGTVDIQGTVNGNLIAFGATITVSGTVTRDVMASGGTISIPGDVQGSARLAGSQVTVNGKIAGDLVVAGSTVTLGSEASVGRDVLAAAGTSTFAGSIARDAQIAGGNVVLGGPIGGNATVFDTSLTLNSGAAVRGDLNYTSNQGVSQASGSSVAGSIHRSYPDNNGGGFVSSLIGWLQTLVGFFLLGALLILLAPGFDVKAMAAFRAAPWTRLGVGVALLLTIPVVALFAFILGLFVGGWWLGLFLAVLYLLALALGYTVAGQMVGDLVLRRLRRVETHPLLSLLTGLVILLGLGAIPWFGGLVGLVASTWGLGVVVLSLPWQRPPKQQAAVAIPPPASLARPTPSAG